MTTPAPRRRATSLGPPEMLLLRGWGITLNHFFGAMPYLVGSAVTGSEWRDVDVRMMLAPEDPLLTDRSRMAALSAAMSHWGQRATGLPVDFQFQHRDEANNEFRGPRIPLGVSFEFLTPWREAKQAQP